MRVLGLGLAVLLVTWVGGLAITISLGPSKASEVLILALLLIATTASLWVRATWAAYLAGGVLSFLLAEFCAHAVWGRLSVQGRAEHFAVLGAALLGISIGAAITLGANRGFLRRHQTGR